MIADITPDSNIKLVFMLIAIEHSIGYIPFFTFNCSIKVNSVIDFGVWGVGGRKKGWCGEVGRCCGV